MAWRRSSRTPRCSSAFTSSRSGTSMLLAAPPSLGRCWAAGYGSCSGRTSLAPCCLRRCSCAICAIAARTLTCRSEHARRGFPATPANPLVPADLPLSAELPFRADLAFRADLHCHSSVSDGTRPPAEVLRRAAAAGLDVVALTDHDTVAGLVEAGGALPAGRPQLASAGVPVRSRAPWAGGPVPGDPGRPGGPG